MKKQFVIMRDGKVWNQLKQEFSDSMEGALIVDSYAYALNRVQTIGGWGFGPGLYIAEIQLVKVSS